MLLKCGYLLDETSSTLKQFKVFVALHKKVALTGYDDRKDQLKNATQKRAFWNRKLSERRSDHDIMSQGARLKRELSKL